MKSFVTKIVESDLCIGCGLCESVSGSNNIKMHFDENGFLYPKVINYVPISDDIIKRICPSVNVVGDIEYSMKSGVWGAIENLYSSYANEPIVRHIGSSGGVVSAIAIFLLETNSVDAVLQVGGDKDDYSRNTLRVSKTREDVLNCASSRYAPALVFDKIIELLESTIMTFCFIGKPCDISGLTNLLVEFPKYKDRFKLNIAIICAGMPSRNATDRLIDGFNPDRPVHNLIYRGNGWPGFFSFTDKNDLEFKMSYNESWGNVLGKEIHPRCKICPDGIGLQADIVVGDAWETKDGYPDFTEKKGLSLLIVRSLKAKDIVTSIVKSEAITINLISKEKLKIMQPYQFNRRKKAGVRIFSFMIVKRIKLNFKNLNLLKNTLSLSIITIAREFLGTLKRTIK
ncbi:Coenzyme F420 hydrogenase/dehydrogenase, beta subunit C-terminal domain [Flavicella sp.]|uniref:Coenzyme F420 hydrogenase/dehydrogenase, beta subunit C-terminal domain n=1 Tax=Flavicella sp. TaxID=2957742 RepID=UPI00301973CA